MFSKRLAGHLERGVVGFPTTLASSVGLIMASPVILTVTSGFGMGGDTFALAVLLAFIMMQAQVTTFAEAATLIPTTGSVYDYIACGMGRFFAITGALCAYLIVHIFAGTAETILAGVMALVNFESISSQMAVHQEHADHLRPVRDFYGAGDPSLRLVRHAAECQRSFRSVRLYRHGDVYVRRL